MQNFNGEQKQSSNKKKQSIVITAVVAILLLITGTFAWRDYRQHKSNVMSGKGMSRDVVLIEDFEGTSDDWTKADGDIRKKIKVENKGDGMLMFESNLVNIWRLEKQTINTLI